MAIGHKPNRKFTSIVIRDPKIVELVKKEFLAQFERGDLNIESPTAIVLRRVRASYNGTIKPRRNKNNA